MFKFIVLRWNICSEIIKNRKYTLHITKTRLFKYIENFTTKNWKFSVKNSDILHISAQNIDRGYPLEPPRWGGSKEYPQSMFLNRNKKNNVYPCKPQFYYIKVGLKGSKLYRFVFVMNTTCNIGEETQEMAQARSTAHPRHQKKERWGTNNNNKSHIWNHRRTKT